MKKSNSLRVAAVTLLATAVLSSCATIAAGGSPSITINGDTRNPVTIITEKQTYANVTLPCTVQVNRHHLVGQRIQVRSDSTEYKDIILDKKINAWTFGNILLGGLIGWGVDLATNCVSEPMVSNFYLEEKK
ncbi:MAG: hypothetical protein K6A82_01315 [Prevotella sp.]|nr:hypothetical protein [Prevotella sp.]